MLTLAEFQDLLKRHGTLVVDGALATELEQRGYDLGHALWSAKVLKENPDSIKKVHLDYYLAGADIAITSSYQASILGFHDYFGTTVEEAVELMKRSVELAQQARDEAYRGGVSSGRTLLIAGSVGPFGAYLADGSEYRGTYEGTKEQFQAFHRPRVRALMEAGADLLAIETMPKLLEIEALLEMLQAEFPSAITWISCTLRNSRHISDGSTIKDVLKVIQGYENQVVAFGANCVPTGMVLEALQHMQLYSELPLICYPNSGEVWDGESKIWSGALAGGTGIERRIREWQAAGARLIGGCCRTGPDYISTVNKACKRR